MQVYNEEDYLLLSGLQHFNFCRRQWALIHIEQQWEENVRTIEGNHLHRKADQPMIREKRGDKLHRTRVTCTFQRAWNYRNL